MNRSRFSFVIRKLMFAGLALVGAACSTRSAEVDLPDIETATLLRQQFPDQAAKVLEQDEAFVAGDTGFALSPPGSAGTWRSLELTLPREGTGAALMRAPGGFEVRVREVGAEGRGKVTEHAVVYRRAGGTSFWTAAPGGYEEWLHLSNARRGEAAAAWEIEGATVRQQGEEVEVVDESGVPRIRVSAPAAYAAGGAEVAVKLKGEGARIELFVEGSGEVLVDPVWVAATGMQTARYLHTATQLQNGKVLVTGGYSGADYLQSAELYDPTSDTWSSAGSMSAKRYRHTATLLPSGKILVIGGVNGSGLQSSVDLYNPVGSTWTAATPMSRGRSAHSSTLLPNGKVLVAGLGFSQVYDPLSNTWTVEKAMGVFRHYHTASLLPGGKVLVAGGWTASVQSSTEIYDFVTDTWAAGPAMNTPRYYHTMASLLDGRVLVAGGHNGSAYLASAEIYDPNVGAPVWTPVAEAMAKNRIYSTATVLQNGRVLIAGGATLPGGSTNSAELFNPSSLTWAPTETMTSSRYLHTATLLTNGAVLVTGGLGNTVLASSEIYTLPLGNPCSNPAQCQTGFCVEGVCCNSACGGGAVTDCQSCTVPGFEGACSPVNMGTVCRVANPLMLCDAQEVCDGTQTTCPPDGVLSPITVCRTSKGPCDIEDHCDGVMAACPPDVRWQAGTQCLSSPGVCSGAHVCTGGDNCP